MSTRAQARMLLKGHFSSLEDVFFLEVGDPIQVISGARTTYTPALAKEVLGGSGGLSKWVNNGDN